MPSAFGVWGEIPRYMVKVLYLYELKDKRCAPLRSEVRTSRFELIEGVKNAALLF